MDKAIIVAKARIRAEVQAIETRLFKGSIATNLALMRLYLLKLKYDLAPDR